jgi:hypothetical protein
VKIHHEYKNTKPGKQIFLQVRKLQIRKFWAHSAIANPQITGLRRSANFNDLSANFLGDSVRK